MSVAKKTWTDAAGRPMTHGELMRGWWAERDRDPKHAPDGDCAGVLEQRGDRVTDDAGATIVHWYGSFTHVILYCSVCHPDLDQPEYVAAVPANPEPVAAAGLNGNGGQPDLW